MNLKKELKKRVAPFILATAISGTSMATGAVVAKAEVKNKTAKDINVEEVTSTNDETPKTLTTAQAIAREAVYNSPRVTSKKEVIEKSLVSDYFDTKKEAQDWIDKRKEILKDAYEITKEEIITSIVKEQVGDSIEIYEEFDNKENALLKKDELESDINNECDLEIVEEEEKHTIGTTVEFEKTFNTQEEVEEYKKSIEGKKDVTITEEVIDEEIVYPEEKVTDISNNSLEQLENEIKSIVDEIKTEETENISYETRVEQDKKEENVLGEVTEEKISRTFGTKEEAKSFIENKKSEETDDVKFEFEKIKERTETSKEESEINEVVDSMEDVNSVIESLKEQGYIIDSYDVTEETKTIIEKIPTGNVIVKNSTKFDSNSYFEANGNFAIIKQGKGTVVVWTLEPLSESEQASFKDSFLKANFDPSIKDSNFEFISGNGEYDLSYLGNNWGTYSINYNDGTIVVECDKDRISHLNVGTFENEFVEEEKTISQFRISGKKHIENNYQVYDVKGIRKEQLYENITTYYATIYKTKKELNKQYVIRGSYVEEEENISKKYVLKGTIKQFEEKEKYKGLIEYRLVVLKKDDDNFVEEKNPDTGYDVNVELCSALLLASTIGIGLTADFSLDKSKEKKFVRKR